MSDCQPRRDPGVACSNDAAAGDTIDFDLTTYPATISLQEQITIAREITIEGPGADNLTISADSSIPEVDRIFQLNNGGLTLSGVTLTGGGTGASYPGVANIFGGAILAFDGALNVIDSVITGNSAAIGGAIYAFYEVNIRNSVISDNFAYNYAGGVLMGAGERSGTRSLQETRRKAALAVAVFTPRRPVRCLSRIRRFPGIPPIRAPESISASLH